MAFNGSGLFSRLYNWVNDRDADVAITASRMDDEMDGMATGLSTCITKDGQTTTTAAIPFAGGAVKLADGSLASPSATFISDTNSGVYWIAADNFSLVTGGVKILELDGDAASAATGLKITNAAAASGVDLSAISSGTNESLTINAKGSGTVTINGTGTGHVIVGTNVKPATNDGASVGVSGTAFSDGFWASGAVHDFGAGDVTLTHSTSTLTNSARMVAQQFRSGEVTVGDDAATSISIGGNTTNNNVIVVWACSAASAATAPSGIFVARVDGTAAAPVSLAWSDATNIAYTTGALAGTTGTDTKLTFSVNDDAKLYVENRLGTARAFSYTILGFKA